MAKREEERGMTRQRKKGAGGRDYRKGEEGRREREDEERREKGEKREKGDYLIHGSS